MRTPTRTFLGCLVSLSILGLVLAGTLNAQSVVVPNSALSAPTGMWLNSLVRQLPRTFQMGIAASELATVPIGSQIVGLSLRAGIHSTNPASWPASARLVEELRYHPGRSRGPPSRSGAPPSQPT